MASSLEKIPLHASDGYNVVVETPRGSRAKFAYDSETGLFRAKKLLAMGFAFPFACGFFPSTHAEDGDPLDALLLTDADLPMGTLVRCRLIGGIAIKDIEDFLVAYQAADDKGAKIEARLDKAEAESVVRGAARDEARRRS